MTHENRIRWSGLALLASGLLTAVALALHPDETVAGAMSTPMWKTAHMIAVPAMLLAVFGLQGVYSRLKGAGWLPLVGYALTLAGVVVFVGLASLEAWVVPAIIVETGSEAMVAMGGPIMSGMTTPLMIVIIAFTVGTVLLGYSIYRQGLATKWTGLMILVGGPLVAWSPPLPNIGLRVGGVLLGAAFAWLGWSMWSGDSGASSLEA